MSLSRPLCVLSWIALAGCATQAYVPDLPPYQPPVADPVLMERAAASDGFAFMHRDLSVSCLNTGSDLHPGCTLRRWTADGDEAVTSDPVFAAYRLDDHHVLLSTADLRITLMSPEGTTEIARGAVDLRVADDGRRITYAQLEGEPTVLEPGLPVTWTIHDLSSGERTALSDDPRDTAPFPLPSSSAVLFVSTRSGLASLWIADEPGAEPRQLTNVGLTEVGEGFVPVPGRELVWLEDGVTAVFSAHYGHKDLWRLDTTTGEAQRLRSGRNPQFTASGDLVAIDDEQEPPRAVVVGGVR
ncbi:MAG: hypothetical protein KC621_34340 [Myxococcales bacterium]|nr:hypothetical protein [Myxococcales bacterium]